MSLTAKRQRPGARGSATPIDQGRPSPRPPIVANVTREVDQGRGHSRLAEHPDDAIDGVFLADTPEVDLHPGAAQEDRSVPDRDVAMIHEGEEGLDLVRLGDPGVAKAPDTAQYADRGIEPSRGDPCELERGGDEVHGFVVHGHGRATRALRDLGDDAVLAEAGELPLDAERLVLGGAGDPLRGGPPPVVDESDDGAAAHQRESSRIERTGARRAQ